MSKNIMTFIFRRFLLLLLVCFALSLFNSYCVVAEDKLDPKDIMKKVNMFYKERFNVPRFVKINSTSITRRLGMADTITTNVVHIYQDGPKAKMEILPGTISYSDLTSTPFDESLIKPLVSHRRNVWVTDGKELKMLYESHPSHHAHGKTKVKGKKVSLDKLHKDYQPMLETMNMEISEVWMKGDYTARYTVYEAKQHIHLASKGFIPITHDTSAKIEMWIDPKDFSIQRVEIDMEHRMDKELVYIESILDIISYQWADDEASKQAGLETLSLGKDLFELDLPDNYEDLTKKLSKIRPLK